MSHNDTQPQEPPKTREQCVQYAFYILDQMSQTESLQKKECLISYAQVYATLALSAPPTEPTPPAEDGAALALLVALVSELETSLGIASEMRKVCVGEEFYEIFHQAQSYVRTQAAKGGEGK